MPAPAARFRLVALAAMRVIAGRWESTLQPVNFVNFVALTG